jgi:hypothetical protein
MQIQVIKCISTLWLLSLSLAVGWARAETATDTGNINGIEFELAADNLDQFEVSLLAADIAGRVRANLAEWEYPLPNSGPYSHQLQARIGKITHSETPVGLSFSSGNSDPRAMDFQKADVLPVVCVFRKIDSDTVIAEAKSTFSAHALNSEHDPAYVTDKLVDQISTACLNLLEDLPRPPSQQRVNSSSFKPKWMPDVRVEVKEVPVIPVMPVAPASNGAAPAVKPNNVELKKEIIIHNQGTPVIFTFGHERR